MISHRSAKRRKLSPSDDALDLVPSNEPESGSPPTPYAIPDALGSTGQWQGWAEIESDPAFFNVILKELGVNGVTVKEIFSLETEMLEMLPRPVYGVIFLFRWKEPDEPIDTRYKAGSKVWFANQTVSNACATYALLNIINNVVGLKLGPQLESFRSFTHDFSPALKGEAVANFNFVKQIHNSFARKMDKLNGDLCISHQAKSMRDRTKKTKLEEIDDDSAYHFIAFMPIDEVIWKMDGLEWQARSLGRVKDGDWLPQIRCELESRMSRYEGDQIEFAILGLVQDPLHEYIKQLAVNVESLLFLRKKTHEAGATNVEVVSLDDAVLGPDPCFGLTYDVLQNIRYPATLTEDLDVHNGEHLLSKVQDLLQDQRRIKIAIKEEMEAQKMDALRAARRRHDCSDAISNWLRFLARKRKLRDIIASVR